MVVVILSGVFGVELFVMVIPSGVIGVEYLSDGSSMD